MIDAGGFIQISGTSWTNSGTLEAIEGGFSTWKEPGLTPGPLSPAVRPSTSKAAATSVPARPSPAATGRSSSRARSTTRATRWPYPAPASRASPRGYDRGGHDQHCDGASLVATNFGGTLAGVTLAGTLDIRTPRPRSRRHRHRRLDAGWRHDRAGSGAHLPGRRAWAAPGRWSWNKRRRLHREFRRRLGHAHHRLRRDHRGISRHHRFR